jgi:hypothetical protein
LAAKNKSESMRRSHMFPPTFTIFHPDPVHAKKLAHAVSGDSDSACLELIAQLESHRVESGGDNATLSSVPKPDEH